MSVLVTGGTGFIGAQVVRDLLEKGERKPIVFDINPSTKLLDDVADRVEVVRGDLGNFSHVLNLVKAFRPRVIYHIGGMLSMPSDADPAAPGWRRAGALSSGRCAVSQTGSQIDGR